MKPAAQPPLDWERAVAEVSRHLAAMSAGTDLRKHLHGAVGALVEGLANGTRDTIFWICPYVRTAGEEDDARSLCTPVYAVWACDKSLKDKATTTFEAIQGSLLISGTHFSDWIAKQGECYEETVISIREGRFQCRSWDDQASFPFTDEERSNNENVIFREYKAEKWNDYPWSAADVVHLRHPHSNTLCRAGAVTAAGVWVVCDKWEDLRGELLAPLRFLLLELTNMLLLDAAESRQKRLLEGKVAAETAKRVVKSVGKVLTSLHEMEPSLQFLQQTLLAAPHAILDVYKRPGVLIPQQGEMKAFIDYTFPHKWSADALSDSRNAETFRFQVSWILLSFIGSEELPHELQAGWPAGRDLPYQILGEMVRSGSIGKIGHMFRLHSHFQNLVEKWIPDASFPDQEAREAAVDIYELLKHIFHYPFKDYPTEGFFCAPLLAAWAADHWVTGESLRKLCSTPRKRGFGPDQDVHVNLLGPLQGLYVALQEAVTCPVNLDVDVTEESNSTRKFGRIHFFSVKLRFENCDESTLAKVREYWQKDVDPGSRMGDLRWAIHELRSKYRPPLQLNFPEGGTMVEVTF